MMKKRLEAGIASQVDLDIKILELNERNQELLSLQIRPVIPKKPDFFSYRLKFAKV